MRRRQAVVAGLLLAIAVPAAVSAQQRPFVTEDPESVGGGVLLIETGFDYVLKQEFPASGLTGNLIRGPQIGISIGLSDIAELQIDGLSFNRLGLTDKTPAPLSEFLDFEGNATSSISDLVIGTKVRLIDEGDRAPSFGLHLATKLPNASNEDGLGLDTIDFYASLLVGKTMDTVRVVANGGHRHPERSDDRPPPERRIDVRRVGRARLDVLHGGGCRIGRPGKHAAGHAAARHRELERRPPWCARDVGHDAARRRAGRRNDAARPGYRDDRGFHMGLPRVQPPVTPTGGLEFVKGTPTATISCWPTATSCRTDRRGRWRARSATATMASAPTD